MSKIFLYGSDEEKYQNYLNIISHCGGEYVFSTNINLSENCDGLLLLGGGDVQAHLYEQESISCFQIDPLRDSDEIALIHKFEKSRRPILGICRGTQIINVAFGGTLIQDISSADRHVHIPETGDQVHSVTAEEFSFLYEIYGKSFSVNSAHHQAVDKVANDFLITTISNDNIIESIENQEKKVYGVQFHPERMSLNHRRKDTIDGRYIFDFFLKSCK
jgi:Predicted glutamine amidotransferases